MSISSIAGRKPDKKQEMKIERQKQAIRDRKDKFKTKLQHLEEQKKSKNEEVNAKRRGKIEIECAGYGKKKASRKKNKNARETNRGNRKHKVGNSTRKVRHHSDFGKRK